MRVYLDCAPLTNERISGIGQYTKNLFLSLEKEMGEEVRPVLKLSRFKKAAIVQKHIKRKPSLLMPISYRPFTIFHGPDYRLYSGHIGPKVVTIHDMQPFLNKWIDPKFAKNRRDVITKSLKSDVQRVIAISEFTKKEIVRFFPEVESKIDVVYHGHVFKNVQINEQEIQSLKDLINGRPFLFFVGNVEERKNLINQIKAFEIVKKDYPDLLFIIGGQNGFGSEVIEQFIQTSKERESIIRVGYMTDVQVNWCYQNTACFMFVSWYEGFGLPILDALGCNGKILTSSTSSCDEVARDFALKANPADVEEIAFKLDLILDNKNVSESGLQEWLKTWSWKTCALNTMKVYQKSL